MTQRADAECVPIRRARRQAVIGVRDFNYLEPVDACEIRRAAGVDWVSVRQGDGGDQMRRRLVPLACDRRGEVTRRLVVGSPADVDDAERTVMTIASGQLYEAATAD